jgi:hypothetical protein
MATVATSSAQVSIGFTHTGSDGFVDATEGAARRAALQSAADSLADYFISGSNVTLTFAVDSYSADNNTLASASSPIYFNVGATGFFQTVIQKKITGGADDNGAANDGNVNWNWHYNWNLGGTFSDGQFDLATTAMHELLHAMGFASMVGAPGTNSGNQQWTMFDRFLSDNTGTALISGTGDWLGGDSALVNGQLYFNGANAVAANGGELVPLYSPASWEAGSSGSHLNFGEMMVMNAFINPGDGPDTLSSVELGMLRDLGYNVIPEPGSTTLLLSGATLALGFLRRRK